MNVFLLWHARKLPDDEDGDKLIGVYATADDADRAKQRALSLPGFRDSPEGFEVDRYIVGQDNWKEGFFRVNDGV